MSALLVNRDGFVIPADGWYQLAPIGEFPHGGAGVVQVLDAAACEAMVNRFREEAEAPNFAGLLVDFDHFSLDGEKKTEAAGWVVDLEYRGPAKLETGNSALGGEALAKAQSPQSEAAEATLGNAGAGLWGKIRWSDVGEAAVKGGRYRHLSPAWSRADCEDLGNGRVRPLRLKNAAVTNDPNMRGMVPLSNRGGDGGRGGGPDGGDPEERFEWVVGANDRHCPSCDALAGQVHTLVEWDAAGVRPGHKRLYCQGNCHCDLQGTAKESSGPVILGPMRRKTKEGEVVNSDRSPVIGGGDGELSRKAGKPEGESGSTGEDVSRNDGTPEGTVANIGWRDEARAASLAVRQAGGKEEKKKREAAAYKAKHGREPANDEEWAEAAVLERDARMKAALGGVVKNAWSDAARAAALAVRRASGAGGGGERGGLRGVGVEAGGERGGLRGAGVADRTAESARDAGMSAALSRDDATTRLASPAPSCGQTDLTRDFAVEKPVRDPGGHRGGYATSVGRAGGGDGGSTGGEVGGLRGVGGADRGTEKPVGDDGGHRGGYATSETVVQNAWSDAARAASLAVRQAKAKARRGASAATTEAERSAAMARGTAEFAKLYGEEPATDEDFARVEILAGLAEEDRAGGAPVPAATADDEGEFHVTPTGELRKRKKEAPVDDGSADAAGVDLGEEDDPGTLEEVAADALSRFEEEGFNSLTAKEGDALMAAIQAKIARGEELTEAEQGFLEMDAAVSAEGGVVANAWEDEARAASLAVRRHKASMRLLAMRDAGAAAFRAKYGKEPFSDTDWEEVEELGGVPREFREYGRGPAAPVPGTEKKKDATDGKKGKGGHFLAGSDVYVIDKDDGLYDEPEPGLPDPVVAAVDAELDAYFGDEVLGNTWSDEAREASIRVRQAKARARKERRERLFTKDIGRPPTDSLLDRFTLQTYEFAPDELVDGEPVADMPDYLKAAMDEEKRIVQEGQRADFVMEKRTELAAAYKERVGRYPVTADDWAAAGVLCGMNRDLAVSFGTGAKMPKAIEDPPSASLLDEKWTEAMAMGMDGIAGGKYASVRGGKKGKEARAAVRDAVGAEELARRAVETPHGTRDPRMAGIGVDSGATVGVPTGEGAVVIGEELPAGEFDRREKASRDAFGISYYDLMIKRDALEEHKRLEAIGPMGQEFLDTARIIEGGVPESMVPPTEPAKPRAFPVFASVNDNPVKPTGPRTEADRLAAIAWEADKKARRAAALEAERRWNAGLSNSWSDQARAAARDGESADSADVRRLENAGGKCVSDPNPACVGVADRGTEKPGRDAGGHRGEYATSSGRVGEEVSADSAEGRRLANAWSDASRAAALAVRRARAGMRAKGESITPGGGQSGGSVPWFDPATGQYVMAVPGYAAGAMGLPGAPAPIAMAPVGTVPGAPVVPVATAPVEARPEAPVTGTVGGVKPRPLPKPGMPGPGRPGVGKPKVPRKG